MEHRRYLEEYSIRTGDATSHCSWTNVPDDDDTTSAKHIDDIATARHVVTIEDIRRAEKIAADKNMNDIMAYL